MSTPGLAPDPNAYFEQLEQHLLDFSLEDQRTALVIYRQLAKGEAVDDAQLARALGAGLEETRARRARPAIRAFTYADPEGRILGFGGLAAAPMHHEFVLNGRKLWTWCAWDSLFIPQLLGEEARVVSPDPRTKNPVRLTVTPDGVTQVAPQGAVVSFIRPDAGVSTNSAENVMATFCHYVFFFESRESGEAWAADHPDTVLYTVDDAVTLAQKLNAWNFGDVLGGA